jgi:CRISPR-associated protein Cmr2
MASHDIVVFGIGPVQSFITAARRTQDLWAASQILSLLALAGVKALEAGGAQVVFPVRAAGAAWPDSVPNRFAGVVSGGQGEAAAKKAACAVRRAWDALAEDVRKQFEIRFALSGQCEWSDIWRRQTRDWLEVYWVAAPWDGSEKTFGQAYHSAQQAMDARKRLRHYPGGAGEPNAKSTLTGDREALRGDRNTDARPFWAAVREQRPLHVRTGEQLSAIDAIKRFAQDSGALIDGKSLPSDAFPSTSSIACRPFRSAVLRAWTTGQIADKAKAHLDALKRLGVRLPGPPLKADAAPQEWFKRYDGDCFYVDSLADEQLKDFLNLSGPPTETQRQRAADARQTLRELLHATTNAGIPPPHPYFAVCVMDGDRMGKLLSSCVSQGEVGGVSAGLSNFAADRAPGIVEKQHSGRLVYAGGDDVLALAPVDDALAIADGLRRAFTEVMQPKVTPAMRDSGIAEPAASAGIAVAHHTYPLDRVVRVAYAAEHAAKNEQGRAAVVVDVLRRSGERRQVGMKWGYGDEAPNALEVVWNVRDALRSGVLSGKAVYELDQELPVLAGSHDHAVPPDACDAEIARLFRRHTPKQADRPRTEALAQQVASLGRAIGPVHLGGWLLLARFLAEGGGDRA